MDLNHKEYLMLKQVARKLESGGACDIVGPCWYASAIFSGHDMQQG